MGLPEILLRPDLGKSPYRLKCRFVIGAFPTRDWLDKAKVAAAEAFVRDLAKQGFEYLDKHGVTMKGPFQRTPVFNLPKPPPHFNAHKSYPAALGGARFPSLPDYGGYATVPLLRESEKWEYELSMVFIHKTILTEVPDLHEERGL